MSWTDFYPVFDDVQIAEDQQRATLPERVGLEEWCAVSRRINERPARHRVVVSLFWKNLRAEETDLTVVSREQMMDAGELGLISRYAPWDHYVKPLLKGAALLREARPSVVLRVYLAADLEFLVEDLVAVGCEVFLMKSSSIRHNPGAMWRFLALEAADEWITVIDADDLAGAGRARRGAGHRGDDLAQLRLRRVVPAGGDVSALGLRGRADVFPLAFPGAGLLPYAGRGIRHLGESGQRGVPLSEAAGRGLGAVGREQDGAGAGGPR